MKKIFSFLCMFMAMTAMISCSSSKEEKGTTGTGNAALDNIFERKSVRTYLNKGVEKEKIDLLLRAGMAAPSGKDVCSIGKGCSSLGVCGCFRPCETGFDGGGSSLCQNVDTSP